MPLGAFAGGDLVGFVLSVPALLRGGTAFYSHMTAVSERFQGSGVGARLKWAQRTRALADGVKVIKWTFEPVKARNAYFNLEKLGAIVAEYQENFYGIDYSTSPDQKIGLASDRLFAEWHLESEKVQALASGESFSEAAEPKRTVLIPGDWSALVKADPGKALEEQIRVRREFIESFNQGLVGRGFVRDKVSPRFLLF